MMCKIFDGIHRKIQVISDIALLTIVAFIIRKNTFQRNYSILCETMCKSTMLILNKLKQFSNVGFLFVISLFLPSSIWHLCCLLGINLRKKNTIFWLNVVILTIKWFCKQLCSIIYTVSDVNKTKMNYKAY